MRPYLSLLSCAALLSSCAYEGTIVEKSHQPHPMYLSQGIEGKFTFIVEDKAGVRHRQMVTPEVFERYAIGQYFNDQETGPSGGMDEGKSSKSAVMTASKSTSARPAQVARKSSATSATKTIAARNAVKRMQRIAAKAKARRTAIAAAKRKRSKQAKSSVALAHVTPVARRTPEAPVAAPSAPRVEIMPAAALNDADLRVVTVARCR
jgi:hypothetical protein